MQETSIAVRTITAADLRGTGWIDDAPSFDQVVRGVTTFLEGFRPAGDVIPNVPVIPPIDNAWLTKTLDGLRKGTVGSNIAKEKLGTIANGSNPASKREEVQQRLLAPLAARTRANKKPQE